MNLRYRTQSENEEKTDAYVNGLRAANYSQYIFCVKKSEEESFLDESQIYLWNNYDSILTLKILIHPGWY